MDNVKNDKYPIIGLVKEGDKEAPETFKKNGIYTPDEKECEYDLFLSVPEWTTFKDGDILISKAGYPFIYNGKRSKDGRFGCYCALSLGNELSVFVENDRWTEEINGYASEKEIEEIKIKLKESDHQLSKTYLKRFFGAEEKKECEFKPFDKVLVRDDDGDHWRIDLFAREEVEFTYRFICMVDKWKQCLPYNDQTAHFLGTSNDPE